MIALIDYDAGNIMSVSKAIEYLGKKPVLTRDPEILLAADQVILPGVGSFGDAMENLHRYDLVDLIHEIVDKKTPFLGICLGLQVLFEGSEESPDTQGLGILKGHIHRFQSDTLKVPHMGWNSLNLQGEGKLFADIEQDPYVYFVHSYYLKATDPSIVKATCEYACEFDASIEADNVFACQFHPEKSSDIGLKVLNNFLNL